MTSKEAIEILVNARYADDLQGNEDLTMAHLMAIKALEQEPCEDAVSREDVLEIISDFGYKNTHEEMLINARIKALPRVTPKPRWIPVSKRLPEINKEVIVTDNETSDTYQSRYIGKGYWECDNGIFNNRIIAWMPKLKPYKAESEERNEFTR